MSEEKLNLPAFCPCCQTPLEDVDSGSFPCPACGRTLIRDEAGNRFPQTVGPYRILAFAGRGGMGIVLQGLHQKTREMAAVKLMNAADVSTADRFLNESATMKRLVHPNVVSYQESGIDTSGTSKFLWIAMNWMNGESLAAKKDFRDIEEKAEILLQVAKGLEYLHGSGVIHRD